MSETQDLNIPLGPPQEKMSQALASVEDVHGERMRVQMGPQHPATHGVLRVEIETDGELIIKGTPHIGYLHRCFEKVAENITWPQIVPFTDRLDYCSSMNNNLGFVLACEKLFGIEVSERIQTIRVLVTELNRVANHCVAIAAYSLDIGAWTPFLLLIQEREHILDLFEEICGGRLLLNYIWIGGLSHDVPDGWLPKVHEFVEYMKPKIPELNQLLSYNKIFIERLANVAVIPADVCYQYGVTGPNIRGAGVKWDLRKNEPYSGYETYDFDIPIGTGEMGQVGDAWDRYIVRVREVEQSLRIIEQAATRLEGMPGDDVKAAIPKTFAKVPKGEIYFRTEQPKGELGFYLISNGKAKPYRVKCRAPSFSNLCVMPKVAPGLLIADMVALIGSIDIVLGDVDR
ncbi:MAG: NADH-quinone oxidoreductase subunit D [Candidatus Hatepunaea meridiana]|nr:NADH-quinone oxidoreductase subunit D [Candidatus Hatepunaea meridiana]